MKFLSLLKQLLFSQISFGSVFWSTEPEKIWTFLDVVMERNIPFVSVRPVACVAPSAVTMPVTQIFSHASPFAKIPDEVRERVGKFGLGVLSP